MHHGAHHALPVASAWGDGTTSSSDRQFFRSARRGDAAGEVNARYGPAPGLGFYTHVSDQHGSYSARLLSATGHEAPYVLNVLLHHGTALRTGTHVTPGAEPPVRDWTRPSACDAGCRRRDRPVKAGTLDPRGDGP
jgi:TnpA family transposase